MYCTSQDIEKQITHEILVQLTNDTPPQDTVDDSVTYEAILYSSTLIDGYLRGKYTLPLDTHFPLLRIIAIDLSIYRLYSRRLQADMPESILAQYKEAIKTLEKIQKGTISLEIETDDGSSVAETKEYMTNKTRFDRTFSHEVLREY
jgi:phage gp36-like protein